MKRNENGFSLIESLLVLIIIGLIAFVGWYVWQSKHKTDKLLTTPSSSVTAPVKKSKTKSSAADKYAGWKTYTLKYEKASIKYPADWTISEQSSSDSKSTQGGVDLIRLNGTGNFQMSIFDGGPNDYGLPFGGATIVHADPITFVGKPAYVVAWEAGQQNTNAVDSINLTTSATSAVAFPQDKNVDDSASVGGTTKQNKFLITMAYFDNPNSDGQGKDVQKPLSFVTSDQNYANAKLVLESFAY